jgi:circadian clock protein KaiC
MEVFMPVESAESVDTRVPTGIAGLDEILGGGLPSDRIYLVEGNPGTGKTTLALQFLLEGVKRGEKGLYVTLSETKVELEQVARSHHWSLDQISLYELEAIEERLEPDEQYTFFHPAEIELSETTKRICQQVEALQPRRVVFDSLSELRLLARDPLRYRRQVLALKQFFTGRHCTVLLLDDRSAQDNDLQLQSICHGVLQLESVCTDHGTTPRRLRIVKVRGVRFQEGFHDLQIHSGGLILYPRLIAAEEREIRPRRGRLTELASTGLKPLDALLGGGMHYGTSTLILGPAGCGKSSLATQFIWKAAKEGKKVVSYLFEEGQSTFFMRAAGIGLNLEPLVRAGNLTVDQIDPIRLSPGEFAFRVKHEVEKQSADMVVIDSLNGYLNAMPSYRYLLLQMHELLTYLNDRGVATFLIMAQHGFMGAGMQTPVDVSYMADSVLMLRYFEALGAVKKAISVIKRRTGDHEDRIREFRVTSQGLDVGEPLVEFRGVLTGVPMYTGTSGPLLKPTNG